MEDSDNALSRTRALVERFVGRHARHHVVGRVSQCELEALAPEHYDEVLGPRRRSTAMFREAVTRGIEEGAFVDIDVPRVVRAMLSLGVDLVRWYRPDGRDAPEQLGEFCADLALGMVTSRDDDATNPAGQDRSTR
ncbi:hypothetical protein FHX42_001555 [Saccharopolyspora lacisalsi]|uniref:HTH-type transcriptional repressor KstR2 C-terminal domain-containing protein n=1 Tax=Halosaccharopolyspora lacisalsi TaxID=1000566 RepID=A0A839DVE6_9PSEU|nr:hypothetical protein [Halosaccharopolyspora lacisalsi]MBA8824226.1 hypothetical protein [Halosaccharopolyspora lacisalsi]